MRLQKPIYYITVEFIRKAIITVVKFNKSALMLKWIIGLEVNEIFVVMLCAYTRIINNLSEMISCAVYYYK